MVRSGALNAYILKIAMLIICVFVIILTFVPLLLREKRGEKILPLLPGNASRESAEMQISDWSSILKALYEVFNEISCIMVSL